MTFSTFFSPLLWSSGLSSEDGEGWTTRLLRTLSSSKLSISFCPLLFFTSWLKGARVGGHSQGGLGRALGGVGTGQEAGTARP